MTRSVTRLAEGVKIIRTHQAALGTNPGVYRMLNGKDEILYIGKARNLRARVAAYTRPEQLPIRLQRMIAETRSMAFTITQSEAEALLLEAVLIKEHLPRYNILLRDDKSFPYIHLSGHHPFPRIAKYRGARTEPGAYFGPFMTAGGAVEQSIAALQRAFLIRNCSDSVFTNRTRPCLQYFINRCSAPCVGYITQAAYAEDVKKATACLRGEHGAVQADLATAMQQASQRQDYESAARLRDRIRALATIQGKQSVHLDGIGDADIIATAQKSGRHCVYVVSYRNSQYLGGHAFYPKADQDETMADILLAFIGQFYADKPVPAHIILDTALAGRSVLAEALSLRAGKKVHIQSSVRGHKRAALALAQKNAATELQRTEQQRIGQQQLLARLAEYFSLPKIPERIEIYDNSHLGGKNALGAMVVAGAEGFNKKAYRKFNFAPEISLRQAGGDDYAMLREMLRRRFARINGDTKDLSAQRPDLLLIDGGRGQLGVALAALQEAGYDDIPVLAIAKGPDRHAGRERLFMDGQEPRQLESNDPVLHFLQRLRDEAHRFAIGGHRQKRQIAGKESALDIIPGIGPSRKRALLHHFGSVDGVKRASLADLVVTKGIDAKTAKQIYRHFHAGAE